MGGGNGVEYVGEEIGILEITQHGKVDHNAEDHQGAATALGRPTRAELTAAQVVEEYAQEIAHNGREDEQRHIVARGFVVEKEADQEKVAVAPQTAAFANATVGGKGGEFATGMPLT